MAELKRFRVRYRQIEQAVVEAETPEAAVAYAMDEHDLEFGQIVDVVEAE